MFLTSLHLSFSPLLFEWCKVVSHFFAFDVSSLLFACTFYIIVTQIFFPSSFGASFFATCGIHLFAIVISWRVVFIGYLLFHYHFAPINKNSVASLLPPNSFHIIFFPYYYSQGARSFYLFWPLMCLLFSLNSFFLLLLFCEEQSSLEFCCYFIGILLPLIRTHLLHCHWPLCTLFFSPIVVQEVKGLFLIFVPLMFF